MKRLFAVVIVVFISFSGYTQTNTTDQKSNIQKYTPSKLLVKGQWDIKWFNNLYTQTKSTFSNDTEPRQTFFTSSFEIFTGVSEHNKFDLGLLIEVRSNVIGGRDALDVLKFEGESSTARSGITSFAPAVKFNPIKNINNFTIQTAFHIPLVDEETTNGVYLDQKGFTFQNRFLYDYIFSSGDWQLFSELNTEFHFGKKEDSFANNSLSLSPGLFLSYFPSRKFIIMVLAQHSQRLDLGNDFSQDYTAIGAGAKYQLSNVLNLEAFYTNFVRGNSTGLGETFNIGLRALF